MLISKNNKIISDMNKFDQSIWKIIRNWKLYL